jgi:hypothetical protein
VWSYNTNFAVRLSGEGSNNFNCCFIPAHAHIYTSKH